MTNYNERLDEILRNTYQGIVKRAVEQHSRTIVEFAERNRVVRDQAKQAIDRLFLDVVEGARWHATDDVYTENRRQRDMALDELRTTITGKEGGGDTER